jgi:hypothetical protein
LALLTLHHMTEVDFLLKILLCSVTCSKHSCSQRHPLNMPPKSVRSRASTQKQTIKSTSSEKSHAMTRYVSTGIVSNLNAQKGLHIMGGNGGSEVNPFGPVQNAENTDKSNHSTTASTCVHILAPYVHKLTTM